MSLITERARALRPPLTSVMLGAAWPLAITLILCGLIHSFVPGMLGAYQQRVMMDVGIAVILAVSLNIVNGFTGQFSIGHAGFLAIGGYVAACISYYFSLMWWGDYEKQGGFLGVGEWLMVGSALVGGLGAAVAGYLVGLPSLRLRGDYLAIVTLGFGEIVRVLLELSNSQLFDAESLHAATWSELIPPPLGGAQGFSDVPKYTNLFWIYLFVATTIVFSYRLKESSTGRALLSIREDEIAAQAMGVNITQLKVRAFVFAAFFAGLAGALYAHQSGTILRPAEAGFQRSFDAIIMVVLGGMGSISGATLAAILLTVAGEWLREPTHVWFFGIVVALVRIAGAARGGWRDFATVGVAVLVIESARYLSGGQPAFTVWDIDLQLYDLAYLAVVLGFTFAYRDLRSSMLFILGVVIVVEVLRALAIYWGVSLGQYRMVIYALLLILMMIFRPQGLFGVRELWDFLPSRKPARASRGGAA